MGILLAVAFICLAREEYKALLKQYDAPLSVYNVDPDRAKVACAAFLKLARDNPSDLVAIDALHWVVTHTFLQDEAGEAMNLLAREHVRSPRIGPICRELDRQYGNTFEPLEGLFRAVLRHNPDHQVQGWTCLALARRLGRDKDLIECQRLQHEAESKGVALPWVPEPKQTDAEIAHLGEESATLFQRVIDEFGEINDEGGTLRQIARVEKALAVGRVAPEIEGLDLDAKPLKLSEFRGKVVLLNFWSHELCGACRGAYPEERSLVERMRDKPFIFLGINNGDTPETLRKIRESGEVTWRFWVDGDPNEGKIMKSWDVVGWPTTFILDQKGVIRHKGFWMSQTPLVQYAVEKLLTERPTLKP